MTKKKIKSYVCGKCNTNITKYQYSLKCAGKCGNWFHKKCSGLTSEQFLAFEKRQTDEKWVCSSCAVDTDDSPEDTDNEDSENPSNKDLLKVINLRFQELEKAVSFNGEIMEALQETLTSMKEENKHLKKEQKRLRSRVDELEKEIGYMKKKIIKEEQEERKKNVIVTGIKGDNDAEANIKKVLTKLGEDKEDYKVSVLPTAKPNSSVIIVQFSTAEKRNKVLEKRKKNALTCQNCGVSEMPTPIYINEDLSRPTRDIFRKARELRTVGFKYVWCKNSQVYVRKMDGDQAIKINSLSEIESLKGQ
nr:unnamed protein product [Callosobruchus analis]